MGVIPPEELLFRPGDLVKVRRGKHRGLSFVVVGNEGPSRVLITDGDSYRAERPKRKNVLHIQRTNVNLGDVAGRVAGGKALDNGWLRQRISEVLKDSSTSCVQGG